MTRDASAHGSLVTADETVDGVLCAHAARIGRDLPGYRHHVYRMLNVALVLADGVEDRDKAGKLAVAAVHHDLGIWTHGTFDYLAPSVALATAFLETTRRSSWRRDVATMIGDHHRITASPSGGLAEAFRRADWVDVTCGLRRFGVPRAEVRALYARWPDAGFHRCLLRLSAARLRTHPLSPLPMVKW